MKLKFSRTVAVGGSRTVYHAGKEYEVKDKYAAELYVAHGYAVPVGQPAAEAPKSEQTGKAK